MKRRREISVEGRASRSGSKGIAAAATFSNPSYPQLSNPWVSIYYYYVYNKTRLLLLLLWIAQQKLFSCVKIGAQRKVIFVEKVLQDLGKGFVWGYLLLWVVQNIMFFLTSAQALLWDEELLGLFRDLNVKVCFWVKLFGMEENVRCVATLDKLV